jgi:hypothetical protein
MLTIGACGTWQTAEYYNRPSASASQPRRTRPRSPIRKTTRMTGWSLSPTLAMCHVRRLDICPLMVP